MMNANRILLMVLVTLFLNYGNNSFIAQDTLIKAKKTISVEGKFILR